MTDDVKKLVEELNGAFAEFKSANDERLSQIESKGAAEGLNAEKVERINEEITRLQGEIKSAQERAEKAETAARRPGADAAERVAKVKAEDLQAFKAMCKGADVGVDEYMAHKAAVDQYLRKGTGNIDEMQAKAMSVDSDPDGGYWVMPDTTGRIVTQIYETSPMRQFANVQTIGTDALEGTLDLDEASSGWVDERESRTETDTPQVGKWRIPVHELYAEPRATQKLLDDSMINVEQWLAGKVADKFARMENAAFVNGNGVGQPRGFLTYDAGTPSATTWKVIQQKNTGASGAFAASEPGDVLVDTMFALKTAYRSGAIWAMNRSTIAEVRKLKDGDGNYLWQPNFQMGVGGTLLGHQIGEFDDMPDIAADSLSIAFGNFGVAYQIVDRIGVRVLRDPYTAKPYVKFYTTKRTGGDVINTEALAIVKFAA